MPWQDKVNEWLEHPVTKAWQGEIQADIDRLNDLLIYNDNIKTVYITKGMIRSLKGVLAMGTKDDIYNPNERED